MPWKICFERVLHDRATDTFVFHTARGRSDGVYVAEVRECTWQESTRAQQLPQRRAHERKTPKTASDGERFVGVNKGVAAK